MAGIGKEIIRRISLVDIVEEHSKCSKAIKELDASKTAKQLNQVGLLTRTGSRAMLRCIGDGWAAFGTYAAVQDPENMPKYAAIGALAFASTYLVDYLIYDVFLTLKKNTDNH